MPENVLNRVANVLTSPGGIVGHWACLPERPPSRPLPRLPALQRPEGKLGAEDLLVVDFARLALNRGGQADDEPSEMVISMRPGKVSREGVGAIVGIMNKVLDFPDVYGWFAVTFDFRPLPMHAQQLETALHIMRWDGEPGWQARCLCNCVHCVILVQASVLEDAKRQLEGFYSFRPPPYCTYLATQPGSDCGSNGDFAIRFSPPESWPSPARAPKPIPAPVPPSPCSSTPSTPLPLQSAPGGGCVVRRAAQKLAAIADGAGEPRSAAAPVLQPVPAKGKALQTAAPAPGGRAVAPDAKVQPAPAKAPELAEEDLPAGVDGGFVFVRHFTRKDGLEELVVATRDGEQSDEGLEKALQYMDRFTSHSIVSRGFAIQYDLRGLRVPSLSMVMKIAAWGNHPDRVARFQKSNVACKIVFNPGLTYTIGKGLVSIFFTQCPPVVRTYIVTNPDDPEDNAVHFDPSPSTSPSAVRPEPAPRRVPEARLPVEEDGLPSSAQGPSIPLLDVGFASMVLHLASQRARCEFRLRVGSGPVQREGVVALLEVVCHTLRLSQVCGDFSMCFDFRGAETPAEAVQLALRARRWRGSADWPKILAERCTVWSVVVQAGVPFKEAHSTLDCFFYLYPPVCPTRLVTSLDENGSGKNGSSAEWLPGSVHGEGVGLPRCFAAEADKCFSISAPLEVVAVPPWQGAGLPCSFDAGFLHLSHGPGQLRVQAAKGRPQTQEGLCMVLAFLDDFLQCFHASGGFAAHFDLRALSLPTIVTVCHLSSWGAEPARRERWRQLCVSCAVVVGSGLVYPFAKGLLSKFFSLCPPVCCTHVLKEPGDPPDSALVFEPGPPTNEAVPRAVNGHGRGGMAGVATAADQPVYSIGLGAKRLHPDDDPWVY